jgi:hypothetical protein
MGRGTAAGCHFCRPERGREPDFSSAFLGASKEKKRPLATEKAAGREDVILGLPRHPLQMPSFSKVRSKQWKPSRRKPCVTTVQVAGFGRGWLFAFSADPDKFRCADDPSSRYRPVPERGRGRDGV